MMVSFTRELNSNIWWMRYRDRSDGKRHLESTQHRRLARSAAKLRERLQARDKTPCRSFAEVNSLSVQRWVDFFLGELFQAANSQRMTHEANITALKHLRPEFGEHES
jgi:hypothetical protein